MKTLRSVSGREGSSFLAVGVGDNVFACKSMSLGPLSTLSLCLIQKNYFRSNRCKYFFFFFFLIEQIASGCF